MKKLVFITIITFLAIGTVSAQTWEGAVAPPATFEGTLQLQQGQIALSAGNAVFFVPALSQYIGFIDGLKEGARISILGYAFGNTLRPVQFTIDGRSYDLLPSAAPGAYFHGGLAPCCASFHGHGRLGGRRGRW